MTRHARSIEAQVRRYRATGIGLWLGGEHKPGEFLFVLDVDTRHRGLESLARLLERLGMEGHFETAFSQTAGMDKGWHYYFTAPFEVKCGNLSQRGYPGIDVKGVGGYVAAPGSLHPDTGDAYRCLRHPALGIARAPDGPLDLLPRHDLQATTGRPCGKRFGDARELAWEVVERFPVETVPEVEHEADVERTGRRPTGDREGDPEWIAGGLIVKFPVERLHTRHPVMNRAIGRLVGLDYDDATIVGAMTRWHASLDALHVVGSALDKHLREVRACVASTRRKASFTTCIGGGGHRADRAAVHLSEDLLKAIRGLEHQTDAPPESCMGYRSIRDLLTVQQEAWVEAAVALCLSSVARGEYAHSRDIRLTSDQIRETMLDRRPELGNLTPMQMSRLRSHFVDRLPPQGPATTASLFREIERGIPGHPSVLEPTGILDLMACAKPNQTT